MKYFKLITIASFLFCSQLIFAQDFEVPQNAKLVAAADYAKYNEDVIRGINWLENTSVQEEKAKRENAKKFLLEWIMGTPDFTIGLQDFQIKLTEKNPDLLLTFLGGWTKFALENPSEKDDALTANIAGLQSLIKVYSANKGSGMEKDKKIEKLIKMSPEKLEKWVKKQI